MKLLSFIVEWSLQNRLIVVFATILFVFYGFKATQELKIDAVPDVTTIQVQVITSSPSLSALEIEQYITFPVERAMGGLQNLEEVRSLSRYGLSVVTIVFKDGTDILKCRQLVAERLKEASDNIPTGYGSPGMGPISTGLGEIFQFTLKSDRHSLMELTTILNWYVNPLLKTVKGIVEVNTFGGNLKQYQVVLDLDRMQSLSISPSHVIEAIRKNNIAMGGGYIEHNKEYYVISLAGLYSAVEDLQKTVVARTPQGIPITLSEISTVKMDKKLRLGATSQDGTGETVGAITMMLMNENSLETAERVKKKLLEIEKNLPEGVKVDVFYDRSVMVKSTVKTIIYNLGEGAVLVIIILLLFLGSLRAGLVIALVIPLAMLFAIVLMNVRDAPANLMSMGAIDFGMIVDGAVIIVENSVRRLTMKIKEKNGEPLTEEEKIKTIEEATLEVRKATIFGEIIIAIVYLPILTLSGVEGKMFKPMAWTVLYALAGAFVLSLSVVPVFASYFLKVESQEEHETKMFHWLKIYYEPILDKFLRNKKTVLSSLFLTMTITVIIFSRLGAEFMPRLSEGSLLLEVGRMPSTALSESVDTATKIEKLLLKKFPEILGMVSRTGSPAVATDPMGLERSDIYLDMKHQKEWRFDRETLMTQLAETVEKELPEVVVSVSQPIEMRTNELIAGIRSDIGIKIFGEDLKTLKGIGEKVAALVKEVQGVTDIKIEQLEGLPYIKIKPNRERMALHGISVDDLSKTTEMISSGYTAGYVFEGNKKFEVSIKIDSQFVQTIDSIKTYPIRSESGINIPLGELADISLETGPVQVSHENQYRRMLVEFNVRGRDMISVVDEVQQKMSKSIQLPEGYRFEFGGKYENYISARKTLYIVVPVTLLIILFILWLAFDSITQSMMIFLNVPFAITGSVVFLLLRDIPFSISAGVGFIALFGVAVLNGLVLISFTKELEHQGISHTDAVVQSAHIRLRPVLTTATVAAIGFIPMAISTSPGAEVQRPLATVVIGGIISSSLLTLLFLPIVYSFYYEKIEPLFKKRINND